MSVNGQNGPALDIGRHVSEDSPAIPGSAWQLLAPTSALPLLTPTSELQASTSSYLRQHALFSTFYRRNA